MILGCRLRRHRSNPCTQARKAALDLIRVPKHDAPVFCGHISGYRSFRESTLSSLSTKKDRCRREWSSNRFCAKIRSNWAIRNAQAVCSGLRLVRIISSWRFSGTRLVTLLSSSPETSKCICCAELLCQTAILIGRVPTRRVFTYDLHYTRQHK